MIKATKNCVELNGSCREVAGDIMRATAVFYKELRKKNPKVAETMLVKLAEGLMRLANGSAHLPSEYKLKMDGYSEYKNTLKGRRGRRVS